MGQQQSAAEEMQEQLFQLRYAAKLLSRDAAKCSARARKEKAKLVQALKRGEMEAVKIFAANSIREHNQQLVNLKLSARVESLALKVKQAIVSGQITPQLGTTISALQKSLQEMNTESNVENVNKFEEKLEDFELQNNVVEHAMEQPDSRPLEIQIEELIKASADDLSMTEKFLDYEFPEIPHSVPVEVEPQQVITDPKNIEEANTKTAVTT